MKRFLSLLLTISTLTTFCFANVSFAEEPSFRGMNDPALREYIGDTLYSELVSSLDSDEYFVSDVQTVYISQEYLDELEFNSQSNVYFGYSLADLDTRFQGTRYVFTLGDGGETVVEEFQGYDDTYDRMIRNVAIGTGVILVCVTVSVVTAGAGAPAISMIFAVAAKTGTTCALSGAALGGVSSAIVTGIQTGDMNEALKAGALGASEGYKWGAITGGITGAAAEGFALHEATMNGLTMNQAATIQRESGLPLDFIRYMHSMEEYGLYQSYGLDAINMNGTLAYTQFVDLSAIDPDGFSNAERILKGLSPLDPSGVPYELHHIGQAADSPLAILTEAQHRGKGIFSVLHFNTGSAASEIDREIFAVEKELFWLDYLEMFGGGLL